MLPIQVPTSIDFKRTFKNVKKFCSNSSVFAVDWTISKIPVIGKDLNRIARKLH